MNRKIKELLLILIIPVIVPIVGCQEMPMTIIKPECYDTTHVSADLPGKNNYIFFWLVADDVVAAGGSPIIDKSCFSQWYPSDFVIANTLFRNAEQFMMYCKAACFGDMQSANAILATIDPVIIKKIGRAVKPFTADEWSEVAPYFVELGNIEKFRQNPRLQEFLISTGDKILVEASPYDKIWGIGLKEEDPRALHEYQWKGKNQLGQILMSVRNRFKTENLCQDLLNRFTTIEELIQYIRENRSLE